MRLKKTERGFLRADFKDFNGRDASIQESSLAGIDALWLGSNEGEHHRGYCLARMHLTRKQVKQLIPLLQKFVETGKLR